MTEEKLIELTRKIVIKMEPFFDNAKVLKNGEDFYKMMDDIYDEIKEADES